MCFTLMHMRYTGKRFKAIQTYIPLQDEWDYIQVDKGEILFQVDHEYNNQKESVFQKMNGQYGLLPYDVVEQIHLM